MKKSEFLNLLKTELCTCYEGLKAFEDADDTYGISEALSLLEMFTTNDDLLKFSIATAEDRKRQLVLIETYKALLHCIEHYSDKQDDDLFEKELSNITTQGEKNGESRASDLEKNFYDDLALPEQDEA